MCAHAGAHEEKTTFDQRDTITARQLHDPEHIANTMHQDQTTRFAWAGIYLGSMVYGGFEGIITTFAVVNGLSHLDCAFSDRIIRSWGG